jgi:dihydroxyacetone kinase
MRTFSFSKIVFATLFIENLSLSSSFGLQHPVMPKPKKIINDPAASVSEFIEGLLLQYPNHLAKLQNHNVVLAAERANQVHLVSGGGSGHEPSHAGWIGKGMLTGAVCGGIFASPSVSAVLAAVRAADSGKGVLLIVKNYTGDRLNFGMAVEKANQEGILCQMVVVADDCALPRTKGITGARGVAGTVLAHKVAGAAAAQGKSLDEIVALVKRATSCMGSLGVALNSVTVPGADQINNRLDEKTIEIGLGIHGEAGMKQSPLLTADEMAREMVTTIQAHGRVVEEDGVEKIVPLFQSGDELTVMVNNLGGISNFEMSILARSCVKLLESAEFGCKAARVMVGTYMTSFNMAGVSLTILNVEGQEDILALLDAPTNSPAWGTCDVWKSGNQRPSATEVPEVVVDEAAVDMKMPPLEVSNFSDLAKQMASAAASSLAENESLLTKYDTVVGDGDCGITMKRGAVEVQKRLSDGSIPTDHPVPMFAALADAVSASMGGTSGILLELMFRKLSSTLSRDDKIGVAEISQAFQAGVDAICLYGGAQVGSRTMLDALVPAATEMVASNSLAAAAAKAGVGANGTAAMKVASAGRSNYLSEQTLDGTPDPGAIAAAIVLEALAKVASA